MNKDSVIECVSHNNIEDVKPPFNTPFTILKAMKKGDSITMSHNRNVIHVAILIDCFYLNELRNTSYYGFEVPYPAENFRELQMPGKDEIEELLKEPQLV